MCYIMSGMTVYQFYERVHGLLFGNKPIRRHFNFEIHLTDSCNLNCASCFHFAPLAEKNTDYPIEEFEKDIQRISRLFNGKFGWIHIMGGEPLLNKRIHAYLDIVGKYVKKGQVDLLTNGMLLPYMDDSFFEVCKRNHIRIAVTKYPTNIDYDRIEKVVKSKGCDYVIFADRGKAGEFCSANMVPDSKMSAKSNYLKCIISNACVTLDRGRLFYCSLPAYVRLYNDKFGHTFDNEEDSISIYDNDRKAILNFLRTPHNFCKYCDIDYRDANPIQWGFSGKNKEEWLKKPE